ncbi:MAG: bifunctional nicotinamidase/pyrazinamidase [Phycisphaerae bacterium]|nr:bifunctional nicotinamidase/pyrazinamidase [Phycisphaerae bacterium]
MNALLLIDLQYDFMPGGALAVADGDAVVPIANRAMAECDLVVATQDWHPSNHASFAANHPGRSVGDRIMLDGVEQTLWPVHCVQGTHGARLHADLDDSRIAHVVRKGMNPAVDSYSGFFDNSRRVATDLAPYLRSQGVIHLFVMGLATDYCVLATALDARSLGYEVTLILDGCRGVELNPGDIDSAIARMSDAGVRIGTSHSVAER